MRLLIFFAIVIAALLPFNILTYRQLVRLHPRRRRFVIAGAILGNLIWPFFPWLRDPTEFSRIVRAMLLPIACGWLSFTLLYSIAIVLLFIAWLPFMRRVTFEHFARRPSRVYLWILIIGFVIGFYQALVPLRVERVPIAIENLPPSLEGKRLVVMADLHVGLFTRPSRLEKIFATAAAQKPDVVLLAGDLIDDDPHHVPKLLDGTRALPPSTPLLAVLGNHEIYGNPTNVITRLRGSRIRLLVNEGVALDKLWIAGVSDYAAQQLDRRGLAPDLGKALAAKPADAIPIVLAHQPRVFAESRKRAIPLTLVAHTHGGQCGFRPLHISLAGLFLPYHMGLYRRDASWLYVNTGTGYWVLPFRLGMTPEITVIELRKE
ncbi:MAG TPA: metallophosphoesterase [Thermoanaerobaculia bacterium]|nr:metallophosphoesterase [Thermoanaerobaculia bacterium]